MIKDGFNAVARGAKYLKPHRSTLRDSCGKMAGLFAAAATVALLVPAGLDGLNTIFGSKRHR